jgi:hypothetical protein
MHSSGEIFLLTELIVFMTLARSVHLRNVVSRNSRYHRTVHDLIQELQAAEVDSLSEAAGNVENPRSRFQQHKPIPYRYLDRMTAQKIDNGSWKVIYRSSYGGARDWTDRWLNQEWCLIRTRP